MQRNFKLNEGQADQCRFQFPNFLQQFTSTFKERTRCVEANASIVGVQKATVQTDTKHVNYVLTTARATDS